MAQFGLENFNIHGNWEAQNILFKGPTISYDFKTMKYRVNISPGVIHEYCYNRVISKGGYNDIKECSYDDKLIALRSPGEFTNRYDSFIENIKTIILYCYAKAFIPVKIFPELYSFSYNKITRKYYLAMEYIPITFNRYIKHLHPCFINELLHKIFDIYVIFDKHGFRFRHGDLTCNNVLVQNGEPILIDFGMSSFYMFGVFFESVDTYNYAKQGANLLHDTIILYHSMAFSSINLYKIMPYCNDILGIPGIFFSGKTLHYFIRIFSGNNDLIEICKKLDYDRLVDINDTLYFRKKTSLNLQSDQTRKIFALITKKFMFHI
jgi:serine/threonine protein kinase